MATRRDTNAIIRAACARTIMVDEQAEAVVDTYLAHLAERGDDEGRLIVRIAAAKLLEALAAAPA